MSRPSSRQPAPAAEAARPARSRASRTKPDATQAQAKRTVAAEHELRRVRLDHIDVPRLRIRRQLGPIKELAYSLEAVGLLQPIQVFPVRSRYRLIAGERRLRAARMLGWKEIEALVRAPTGDELLLELVENAQRKFLTDAEEADALIRLVRDERYQLAQVAAQAGRSQAYVSKRIRVFEDLTLRSAVEQRQLSVSLAEEFLTAPATERAELVAHAIDEGWDVHQLRSVLRGEAFEAVPGTTAASFQARASEALTETIDTGLREIDAGLVRALLPPPPRRARRADNRSIVERVSSPRAAGTVDSQSADGTSIIEQLRQVRDIISRLRPSDLSAQEQQALSDLFEVLVALAKAHQVHVRALIFPSLAAAGRLNRRARTTTRRR